MSGFHGSLSTSAKQRALRSCGGPLVCLAVALAVMTLGSTEGVHESPPGSRASPAPDLAALRAATGYRQWPRELVTTSKAKHLPRMIYRSPRATLPMSVAETLLPDGRVRETEVALERGSDGHRVDFFVYDTDGHLADEADFGPAGNAVLLPAPQICLRCHFDATTRSLHRRPVFADARP